MRNVHHILGKNSVQSWSPKVLERQARVSNFSKVNCPSRFNDCHTQIKEVTCSPSNTRLTPSLWVETVGPCDILEDITLPRNLRMVSSSTRFTSFSCLTASATTSSTMRERNVLALPCPGGKASSFSPLSIMLAIGFLLTLFFSWGGSPLFSVYWEFLSYFITLYLPFQPLQYLVLGFPP